jgi:CysZ protein
MILQAFLRALGQTGDRRFRRVIGLGALLSLALLVAVTAGFLQLVWWLTPDSLDLPVIGPVTGIESLLGWAAILVMLGLSVVLMVPVAALFSGLFLEDVADAVEARHYAALPPARSLPFGESLRQAVNLTGLIVGLNALGLLVYPLAGPLAPLVFWAVNGALLGREYFMLVALRRLPPTQARDLRSRHSGRIWAAGVLMAMPLSLPLLNLVIPVLGVATFTHLFHRLAGTEAAVRQTGRG